MDSTNSSLVCGRHRDTACAGHGGWDRLANLSELRALDMTKPLFQWKTFSRRPRAVAARPADANIVVDEVGIVAWATSIAASGYSAAYHTGSSTNGERRSLNP